MPRNHASFEPVEIRLSQRIWLPLFSLCVACLFLGLSPSRAEATCGDYLAHHGEMSLAHSDLPEGTHPNNDVPHRKRCNGPSCRQAPMQSPVPVPVVTFETQDRWVTIASLALNSADHKSFLAQQNEPVCLPMIAFRLDRPPKA